MPRSSSLQHHPNLVARSAQIKLLVPAGTYHRRTPAAHLALGNDVEHAPVFVRSTLQPEGRTSVVELEDMMRESSRPSVYFVVLVLLILMPWLLVVLTLRLFGVL